MRIPQGDLDLLAIGETLVDFISIEETDSLRDAHTFRKYQGGSPANIAVYVAKLGGKAAVVSKTGIGVFGQFLKAELQRGGVVTDYFIMDHRVHTSVIFVSRTRRTPDFEAFRSGDYRLEPREVDEGAVERAKVIHASTWPLSREPSRSAVERGFQLAQKHGKIISLDPNYTPQIWPAYREAKEVLRRMLGYATITKHLRLTEVGEGRRSVRVSGQEFESRGLRLKVLEIGLGQGGRYGAAGLREFAYCHQPVRFREG